MRRPNGNGPRMAVFCLTIFLIYTTHGQETTANAQPSADQTTPTTLSKKIRKIIIEGAVRVPEAAILSRIPFRVGETFDPRRTRELIHTLYYDLKRFRNISVYAEPITPTHLDLYIVVVEKPPLKDIIFKGNKQITSKLLAEKINLTQYPTLEAEQLTTLAQQIKRIYTEKGYHRTTVDTELQIDDHGKAIALFTITEHRQSLIKRISFSGNDSVSDKMLRAILYSREDWLLSFMDKAGLYQPERLEGDKQMIEQYYQNRGYLNARVIDVVQTVNPDTKHFSIRFDIQEGEQYRIGELNLPQNENIPSAYLFAFIPLRPGQLYSRERVVDSIKILEAIWGNMGYIFAHIEPSIIPNDTEKTVSISFDVELGHKVFLNRITISGNRKTRDRIIRRQLALDEGDVICTNKMDTSKIRVESLGYFEVRDGVNWKINRIDEETANLDLIVQEAKTGNLSVQLGLGGAETTLASPLSGLSAEFSLSDTNLFGEGIRVNLMGKLGKDEKTLTFNLTQPWLFNKPIFGAFDFYHQRYGYDEFNFTRPVNEQHTGGSLTTGFMTGLNKPLLSDTFFRFTFGFEGISYSQRPRARITQVESQEKQRDITAAFDTILSKLFDPGKFAWFSFNMGQDKKNHPMHPSNGYAWFFRSHTGIPTMLSNIGFQKFELDYHWFTPLINAVDLVFHWHSNFGLVTPIKNRVIPYSELYHIGGPASVRGFTFGQIGPQFCINDVYDSIGAEKAFFINAELIFPIMPDMTMKGVVFYDGGAGWDNPYAIDLQQRPITANSIDESCTLQINDKPVLQNNGFSYRHAIGIGIRMLQPMPVRIDWGFKLDRRKNRKNPEQSESSHEVHFSMTYDW